MRNRLIVTGTAAAMVLTAGIVGAVAVQPSGQSQDRDTTAAPAALPDVLQGMPPMMVKRDPAAQPGEKGTVDVRSRPDAQPSPFTYTPPAQEYVPRHMADRPATPGSSFTHAPLPGIDFGNGSAPTPAGPTPPTTVTPRPVHPTTPPPTQTPPPSTSPTPSPTPTPEPTPEPTPTPTPEPTPTPTPEPEPTDPPSEEPTTPPSEEPTPEPTQPSEEPTPEPSTEPSPEPSDPPTDGSTPGTTPEPSASPSA
ncbi:hypothetical protein [Promicromonospora sp. NPDC050880]|uniref:hypothetical protein n=1 Tax=unclassified Promicromonospora TaxID=2647929 RepID=UPI00379EAAA1